MVSKYMNKRGKPIELILLNNNSGHRGKDKINERIKQESMMRIGNSNFQPTARVLADKEALKRWNEVCKIFNGFQFVTDVDTSFIEKYCLTHSEYCQLQETRNDILNKNLDNLQTFHAMDKIHLHYQINKKLDMLIKFEDRMFLNPASRIRNIPQKQEEVKKVDPLDKYGLINV